MHWSITLVIVSLLVSSVAAAFVSDWFVAGSDPGAFRASHVEAFAGLVVVAIAGDAVENIMKLSRSTAAITPCRVVLQSPVQIALLLRPALVLLSGVLGGAHLSLVLSTSRRRTGAHDADRCRCRCPRRRIDLARGRLPRRPLCRHRQLRSRWGSAPLSGRQEAGLV